MIRSLCIVGFACGLAACQPVSGGEEQQAAASVGGGAVPATYDWSFVAHGGSADLVFGDGDRAEGVRLFNMSCLPNSQAIGVSWNGDGEAVLTSGTATGTFRAGDSTPADHPVFTALRDNGSLAVGMNGTDLTLSGEAAGREAIADFFDFCTQPLPPEPVEVAPVVPDVAAPSEGDDQPDDLTGVKPVEPGVDVVQPDGAAHQSVDG